MAKRVSGLLLVFLGTIAMQPLAQASVLLHLSMAEMTEQSSAILLGRCVEVKSAWDEGSIVTHNVFEVREYYKGNLGLRLTITEPGGQVENMVAEYPGVPQFQVGEEAVLFVWTSPRGRHTVIGLTQGKFRVRRDSKTGEVVLRQSSSNEPMLEPAHHSHGGTVSPLSFSLAAFRQQVAAMSQRPAPQKRPGGIQQ